jgi:hypothetical protein
MTPRREPDPTVLLKSRCKLCKARSASTDGQSLLDQHLNCGLSREPQSLPQAAILVEVPP